jgi:hypothetical protein
MTNTQSADTPAPDSVPQVRLTLLRQMLVTRFSVDELKTLCVDLGLEYDALPGDGKEGKARELVAWFDRRHRLPELEDKSKQLRPDIAWEPEPPEQKPAAVSPSLSPYVAPASHETINRLDVVSLFHAMMQPDSRCRVLRLIGDAKSGKSHLVTKVFPAIAQDNGVPCAVMTLRNTSQDAADILHAICSYLGGIETFTSYQAAYEQMQNRARAQVSGVQAWFSRVSMKVEPGADDPKKLGRDLVPHFVAGLRQKKDALIWLLFDAVNDATGMMQEWLTDTLVGQAAALAHVRIVVAGRSVPEPCGSYTALCRSYELLPVEEEEAYIHYCSKIGAVLPEQSIRDFARACKYRPGLFADLVVPTFARGEATHA